jgi:hypothetical protein
VILINCAASSTVFSFHWQATEFCFVVAGTNHTVQSLLATSVFDNCVNTSSDQQTYHHASTKAKLQKAAQASGQRKLAFATQKQPI